MNLRKDHLHTIDRSTVIWCCEHMCGCVVCLLHHPHNHSGMSCIAGSVAAARCVLVHHCLDLTNVSLDARNICGVLISMSIQFSALDVLAGMMMKGAAKCDKHAE